VRTLVLHLLDERMTSQDERSGACGATVIFHEAGVDRRIKKGKRGRERRRLGRYL